VKLLFCGDFWFLAFVIGGTEIEISDRRLVQLVLKVQFEHNRRQERDFVCGVELCEHVVACQCWWLFVQDRMVGSQSRCQDFGKITRR
jgi:hypothetical protein